MSLIFSKLSPSSRNLFSLKNPQPKVGILDLPYKLRLRIFRYIVVLRRPICRRSFIILRKMLLEPILICKTSALEALKVFYGENTFLLKPYKSLRTVLELYTFLPH